MAPNRFTFPPLLPRLLFSSLVFAALFPHP
jgi:hypothetical protein